jgi:hypothetical protein
MKWRKLKYKNIIHKWQVSLYIPVVEFILLSPVAKKPFVPCGR